MGYQHEPLRREAGEDRPLFKMHPSGHYYRGDLTWNEDNSVTFQPYDDNDPRQSWNMLR